MNYLTIALLLGSLFKLPQLSSYEVMSCLCKCAGPYSFMIEEDGWGTIFGI